MKRYDSLRALFWVLAAGLSTGAVSAATTITADNSNGATVSVGIAYGNIPNFTESDTDISGAIAGGVADIITLAPGSNNPTLSYTGSSDAIIQESFTFDNVGTGPMNLQFNPTGTAIFTNTGSYISNRQSDVLDIAGDSGATVQFTGNLSGFKSHLQQTSGSLSIISDNDVMTDVLGGQITITTGAGTTTLGHSTSNRTVGSSAHTINIGTGKTLTLTGPGTVDGSVVQTIASTLSGTGQVSVTSGEHLLSGSPINNTGGLAISDGRLRIASPTDVAITGTGGVIALEGNGTYGGAIALTSTELVSNNAGVITLTAAPTYTSGTITIAQGTLSLENDAIFTSAPYRSGTSGSGILQMNVEDSVTKTLTGGLSEQGTGKLTLTKTGPGTLAIVTNSINTTGPVNIDAGAFTTAANRLGANFLSESTAAINVASGASMTVTPEAAGFTLARPLTGEGTVTFSLSGTNNAPVTLSNANIAVGTIALTGAPSSGFALDITGDVPSSDITTDDSNQLIKFSGGAVAGEYAGAITGTAPVTVTNGADVQFRGASTFGGQLTVSAAGIAELAESSIKDDRYYMVEGTSSKLKLHPTATHTISTGSLKAGSDTDGTIEIVGGNTTATAISFTAQQLYNGKFDLTDAYLSLGVADAISSAATTTLYNNSVLDITTGDQSLNNLATASNTAELKIGSSSIVTLKPTSAQTFAGKITSTGGGIVHDSTSNQTLSGDLSGFGRNITTSNTGVLAITSAITLGANSNTYTVSGDGTLKFTGNTASLLGDITLDGASGASAIFDGVTLRYLPTATGSTKTISGGGGMLVGSGGLTLTTDFGRSIINTATSGLKANTGAFTKEGFGTFELGSALTTTYSSTATAINVTAGTLKLVGPALAGAAGGSNADISIAAQSILAMDLNNTSQTFARHVAGDGSIVLSSTANASTLDVLTLSSTAKLLNKGDMTIGSYAHLNINDVAVEWQPGSAAKIAIEANGALTLGGIITPDGGTFNPYFVSGAGTINTHAGADTTIAINASRQGLLIGNTADSLEISSGQSLLVQLAAGKRAEMKYNLLAGDTASLFGLNSAGTLYIEGNALAGYQGIVRNAATAAGQFWLKDIAIKTSTQGTQFDFGHATATTTFEITTGTLTLGQYNDLKFSSGTVSKIGAGRLIFDTTTGMQDWTGALNVYSGDVEFHKVSRNNTDNTQVHKGARVVAWRDFGASSTALTLGNLTLNSGSTLIVTDRDWDLTSTVSDPTHRSTVNVHTLATSAGAEIAFVVDSAGASAGTNGQTFSTAMLSITQDYSANANGITAPLYIRLAPALANTDYTANAVFSLIEFANAGSATNFVAKIKLRPTVGTLVTSEAGLGTLTNGVSGKYAHLYIGSDRYLVAQINSTGFAPGLRPAAKTDFSATTYPIGTYTVTSLLDSLMGQNFAAYSALDGVLAAVTSHDRHFDYHMSLLSPASYQQASQMLHNGSMFLQPYAEQGMFAIAEQQRWAQHVQQDSGSNKLAGIVATLQDHQNLQSETQVKSRGTIQSWDSVVSGISFNDKDASHQMDARVVGLAWRLSPRAAIGYQHITSAHQYKALDGKTHGQKQSLTGQGFAQVFADNVSLQTLSSVSVHQNTHQRDMAIEVAEALVDRYSAHSTSTTTELSQSVTAAYQNHVASGVSVDVGVKAQAQYAYTPKFTETGADNLSLVVESQHHAYMVATPTVALDLRQVAQSGWTASRFTVGYQQVVAQKNTFDYGFKDINARYQAQADQPDAQSGFTLGYQSCFANASGLSLQLQYQTFAGQTHQGQVSVSYDF